MRWSSAPFYCCCGGLLGGGFGVPNPPLDPFGLFCVPEGELPKEFPLPKLLLLPNPVPVVPLLPLCPFRFGVPC